MNKAVTLFSIIIIATYACNKGNRSDVRIKKPGNREMTELNTYFVEKDRERIISYGERKNLNLKESKSGLWYQIKDPGTGPSFRDKDRIVMKYNCFLLDGTLCYSSETTGPKVVMLGRSEMESGLDEGLRMLGRGGEAIFIIPPFLGYGLVGDNKAIPARAILVYEIKILD